MSNHVHTILIAAFSTVAFLPGQATAADARVGVHPTHGEMVLLRDVNARPAYRPAPPGIGLIVDPRPNREIHGALGTGELSDADFAALSSGHAPGPMPARTAIEGTVNRALAGTLGTGGNGQNRAAVPGGNVGAVLGGPLGTVGATTRGIGGHVTGALSQFPFGQTPAAPTGPGGP